MVAFESVSTWRQPEPAPLSPARTAVVAEVADRIHGLRPGRLRVAVDGYTAAGKTSFGHEIAAALRERGRPTLRASLDDFKHPWRHAREHGCIGRDTVSEGGVEAATRLHRDRYHAAEAIYLADVDPRSRADVIVDNKDFARPRIC